MSISSIDSMIQRGWKVTVNTWSQIIFSKMDNEGKDKYFSLHGSPEDTSYAYSLVRSGNNVLHLKRRT